MARRPRIIDAEFKIVRPPRRTVSEATGPAYRPVYKPSQGRLTGRAHIEAVLFGVPAALILLSVLVYAAAELFGY